MPTTAPLSREQAIYLRCIRRAQEAGQILDEQWLNCTGNPKLEEALFLGAQALRIEISEHFRSLRYWGGLLFAGPESAAWEMAKKMQPRVAQGGEA